VKRKKTEYQRVKELLYKRVEESIAIANTRREIQACDCGIYTSDDDAVEAVEASLRG
jgi:hypothetical protein